MTYELIYYGQMSSNARKYKDNGFLDYLREHVFYNEEHLKARLRRLAAEAKEMNGYLTFMGCQGQQKAAENETIVLIERIENLVPKSSGGSWDFELGE
jgi:hypothetical protein